MFYCLFLLFLIAYCFYVYMLQIYDLSFPKKIMLHSFLKSNENIFNLKPWKKVSCSETDITKNKIYF